MASQYCKSDQILGCNLVDSHLHWHKSLRAQQEAKTARKTNTSITIIWNYFRLYVKIEQKLNLTSLKITIPYVHVAGYDCASLEQKVPCIDLACRLHGEIKQVHYFINQQCAV